MGSARASWAALDQEWYPQPCCSISWLRHPGWQGTAARERVGRADLGHPGCGPSPPQISSKLDLSGDLLLIGKGKLNSETSPHKAITLSYELSSGNISALAKLKSGNTNISPKQFFNVQKCRTYYSEVSSCR